MLICYKTVGLLIANCSLQACRTYNLHFSNLQGLQSLQSAFNQSARTGNYQSTTLLDLASQPVGPQGAGGLFYFVFIFFCSFKIFL